MKPILLSTFLVFLGIYAQAQVGDVGLEGSQNLYIRLSSASAASYDDIQGSPYVNSTFIQAKIGTDDKDYSVRYDAYNEKMQVQLPNESIMNLNYNPEYVVVMGDYATYVPVKYPDGKTGFARLLWQNEEGVQLLRREQIEYVAATQGNGYQGGNPAKFSPLRTSLYFMKDGNVMPLPNGKNAIFTEVFDEDFKSKAKKEKLNPKKEEDLIQLFELYYQ